MNDDALSSVALPDKPSELIKCALDDLVKCDADPKYKVSMDYYHRYDDDWGVCSVCLAGSVMAQTLNQPHTLCSMDIFNKFDDVTRYKMYALDCFRRGNIWLGLKYLRKPHDYERMYIRDVDLHGLDAFLADMRKVVEFLEAKDL